jgi:ATP-dependent RNA helicase DDX21
MLGSGRKLLGSRLAHRVPTKSRLLLSAPAAAAARSPNPAAHLLPASQWLSASFYGSKSGGSHGGGGHPLAWPLSWSKSLGLRRRLDGSFSTLAEDDREGEEPLAHAPPEDADGNAGIEDGIEMFDLSPRFKSQLMDAGVTTLFPVQRQCLQLALEGRDIMCKSRTGSGKTLAFAIPIIESLERKGKVTMTARPGHRRRPTGHTPSAVVVAPTRELAKQVEREFARIAPGLDTLSVYGGAPMGAQIMALRRGVDIVVGTPGRLIDHLERGTMDLSQAQHAVLDEADLMLQMGFQDDVERIFSFLPAKGERQTMLWSATMPHWVNRIARQYLAEPHLIDLVGDDDIKIPDTIAHWSVAVDPSTKRQILGRICSVFGAGKRSIVFAKTKNDVDELATDRSLAALGVEALHGGLAQSARERTLERFRKGKTLVLVATDVAARGLDIPDVNMVIHYNLPMEKESFVHRSGRTGRAGRSGLNVVLCSKNDERELRALEKSYSFTADRIVAPGPESLAALTGQDVADRVFAVPPSLSSPFEKTAQQLLDKAAANNVDVGAGTITTLSACLALLAGAGSVAKGEHHCFSMLTGAQGFVSLLLTGVSPAPKTKVDVVRVLRTAGVDVDQVQLLGFKQVAKRGGGILFDVDEKSSKHLLQAARENGIELTAPSKVEGGLALTPARDSTPYGGSRGGYSAGRHGASGRYGAGRGGGGGGRGGSYQRPHERSGAYGAASSHAGRRDAPKSRRSSRSPW